MKERFLNLNHFAGKILAVLATLLILIPLGGWILSLVGLRAPVLSWIIHASLYAGIALLFVFILLVILEQILDARLFRAYRKTLNRRIPLADGFFECPACGFRHLRGFDRVCPSCGKEFQSN